MPATLPTAVPAKTLRELPSSLPTWPTVAAPTKTDTNANARALEAQTRTPSAKTLGATPLPAVSPATSMHVPTVSPTALVACYSNLAARPQTMHNQHPIIRAQRDPYHSHSARPSLFVLGRILLGATLPPRPTQPTYATLAAHTNEAQPTPAPHAAQTTPAPHAQPLTLVNAAPIELLSATPNHHANALPTATTTPTALPAAVPTALPAITPAAPPIATPTAM